MQEHCSMKTDNVWLGVVEMILFGRIEFSRKSPSKFYDVRLHLAGSRPHGHQFPSVLLPYSIIFYNATMTTGMYGLGRSKSSRKLRVRLSISTPPDRDTEPHGHRFPSGLLHLKALNVGMTTNGLGRKIWLPRKVSFLLRPATIIDIDIIKGFKGLHVGTKIF